MDRNRLLPYAVPPRRQWRARSAVSGFHRSSGANGGLACWRGQAHGCHGIDERGLGAGSKFWRIAAWRWFWRTPGIPHRTFAPLALWVAFMGSFQ